MGIELTKLPTLQLPVGHWGSWTSCHFHLVKFSYRDNALHSSSMQHFVNWAIMQHSRATMSQRLSEKASGGF